jgi:hypothetical protein
VNKSNRETCKLTTKSYHSGAHMANAILEARRCIGRLLALTITSSIVVVISRVTIDTVIDREAQSNIHSSCCYRTVSCAIELRAEQVHLRAEMPNNMTIHGIVKKYIHPFSSARHGQQIGALRSITLTDCIACPTCSASSRTWDGHFPIRIGIYGASWRFCDWITNGITNLFHNYMQRRRTLNTYVSSEQQQWMDTQVD